MRMLKRTAVIELIVLASIVPLAVSEEDKQSEREAMYYRYLEFASYVKGGSITPHWMADGSSFWYAEGAPENTVIWKVDPVANTKTPLFDTARLREALTKVLGHEPAYQGLPFDTFTSVDPEKAVKFTVEDTEFLLDLETYEIRRAPAPSEQGRSRPQGREVLSPDGRWIATVKDYNLWLTSTADGRQVQLTRDGVKDYEWVFQARFEEDEPRWSPDSTKLAVKKVDYRKVHKIPVVHWLKTAEEIEWVVFPRADGELPVIDLFIVDALSKRQVRVKTGEDPDQYLYLLGWWSDGSELIFMRADRAFKRVDLMAANPTTGLTRKILSETQKTFVRAFQYGPPGTFTLLGDGKTFIWMSERDGWSHLYLYDLHGTLIRRLTEGAFPVRRVSAVNEKGGWVYLAAHGNPQRPYDTQLYRVSLEGKGLVRLTEEDGRHDVQFAPSKEFFIDTHSALDRPPVVELRRADGTVLQVLSRANVDALNKLKWNLPEKFVVKAADETTDLYGVLFKPYDFDPKKKYPVIEVIYAGPQDAAVPRTFTSNYEGIAAQALAQLGFITFVVDGRGTPARGKDFQDVVYGNIGRYEIPDHMATLRQLAEKRSFMDLSRVGVYGHSWGGHFAVRALLLAPDVYQVGIAVAPDTDLYYHIPVDVETWMGRPQDNQAAYDYGSNPWLAANLRGKLLLIHGTSDVNVPFSMTMRMVEALIRAHKPYDLIVLPEQDHGGSGMDNPYVQGAVRRYFQEHLKP